MKPHYITNMFTRLTENNTQPSKIDEREREREGERQRETHTHTHTERERERDHWQDTKYVKPSVSNDYYDVVKTKMCCI